MKLYGAAVSVAISVPPLYSSTFFIVPSVSVAVVVTVMLAGDGEKSVPFVGDVMEMVGGMFWVPERRQLGI